MSPPLLLSIDPGIDLVAVATFTLDPRFCRPGGWYAAPLETKARCLTGISKLTTKATDPMEVRLAHVALGLSGLIRDTGAARIVLEQPARPGVYRRHANAGAWTAGAVMHVWMGYAACLIGVALGGKTPLLIQPSLAKASRHLAVYRALSATPEGRAMHATLPHAKGSPLPKTSGVDVWDAIAVGLLAPWEL